MPELPEVDTIRRQLAPVITGRRIVDAGSHWSEKFTPATTVCEATITGVRRRGKYLLIELSDDRELIIHLGMTGTLVWRASGALTPDRHRRAWWLLDDDSTLDFSDIRRFGRIRVVATGEYDSITTLARLGPEPLSDDFTVDGFHRSVRSSRRHIKTQLLGQRAVAGVGNIYADEALWRAGVRPTVRRLGRARAEALHRAIRDVIRSAIANDGTTLRDYRTASGEPGRNQSELDCYGRSGRPCRRCGTTLRHHTIDARTTTFCPTCQT